MPSSVDMWKYFGARFLLTRWLGLVGLLGPWRSYLSPFVVSASVDCLSLACWWMFIFVLVSVFVCFASVAIDYCERSGPVDSIGARDCFWVFLCSGFLMSSGAGLLIYRDMGTKR